MLMDLLYHNVRLWQVRMLYFCEKVAKTPVRHLLKFSHFLLAIAQRTPYGCRATQSLGNTGFFAIQKSDFRCLSLLLCGGRKITFKKRHSKAPKLFLLRKRSKSNFGVRRKVFISSVSQRIRQPATHMHFPRAS